MEKRLTRGAGILMPISSLPAPYGIGTLGKVAYEFIDQLVEAKQTYWQVLPIGPTSIGDSPYQSFSSFAGNPYFVDLDQLCQEGLLTKKEIEEVNWGTRPEQVAYGVLWRERYKILRGAFRKAEHTLDKEQGYKKFCKEQDEWLSDYALFMSCKGYYQNQSWLDWEEGIRRRDPIEVAYYNELLGEEVKYWKFIQYKFYQQWDALKQYANERGIHIIGDMPIYVALDSADVWSSPEQFQLDENLQPVNVSGAPPDVFSDEGQKWGNPLYRWKDMEQDGFTWWKRRMGFAAHSFDVIRIDHFIGLVRYYVIGADKSAKEGSFKQGPGIKFLKAIEEVMGNAKLIAEDLGVLIPKVERVLSQAGYPGMRILELAFDGNRQHPYLPHNYIQNCVVYGGTHDNDTMEGYYDTLTDSNLDYALEYTGANSRDELVDAVIRMAYESVADTVIFQMQDILKLGSEARMNFVSPPGSNWVWRMKQGEFTKQRIQELAKWSDIYGRIF